MSDGRQHSREPLQEIIITAQRRNEPIQKTPVSVIALSAADLEARSITNLDRLHYFVPNLTLAPSQNVGAAAGNAFIRGIGQEDFIAGSEPGVAMYIDGVYIATTRGTLTDVTDVARVEIMRGPQGTLFGRNAIGGAIQLITNQPQRERSMRTSAVLGSFDRREMRVVVNEPVAHNLFFRTSVAVAQRDGYLKRLRPPLEAALRFQRDNKREGDQHEGAGRLQMRWLMTKGLTIDLAGYASRARNHQGAIRIDAIDQRFGVLPVINRLIRAGSLPGPEITDQLIPHDFFASYAGGRNFARRDAVGASATIANETDVRTLKLILAWRNLKTWIGTDTDGLYFNLTGSEFRDNHHQYSAELQLHGLYGRLTYNGGLFALAENARSLPTRSSMQNEVLYSCGCFFPQGSRPRPMTIRRDHLVEAYAIYGQGTYRLTSKLSATLGARYSHETKSVRADSLLADPETLEPTDQVAASGSNQDYWPSLTWRTGLQYQASPDVMLYASAAKGYKSGGFNVRPVASLPNLGLKSFAPENALTYEVGIRSQWLGRRLRLNATVFHTDYTNIQLRRQTYIENILSTLIENAAEARIVGLELEAALRPTTGLTLGASYGHTAARYIDPGRAEGISASTSFQRTPRHSGTAWVQFERRVFDAILTLDGNVGFRSKEQFQILPRLYDQRGYGLAGARLAISGGDRSWTVAVFATNLANERYRTAGRGTVEDGGIAFSSVGPPRQIGVQAEVVF